MDGESECTFRGSDLHKNCFNFFSEAKEQKRFCDVEFTVGTQQISAHRVILAATIPYFRKTLTNDKKDISVPDNVDGNALQSLIDFAYGNELKITKRNVKNLICGACRLGIDEVRDACCDFLSENLYPEAVLHFKQLAEDLNCSRLDETVDQYVADNFVRISQTEEFPNFSFQYVKKLIAKDDLFIESEERVLEAILIWIRKSPKFRITKLPEMLPDVRMAVLKPKYLKNLLDNDNLIQMSNFSADMIDEAINHNSYPLGGKKTFNFHFQTEPREFMKATITNALGQPGRYRIFRLHGQMMHIIEPFDCIKKKGLPESKQSCDMTGGTVAEYNKKMYFFRWGDALQYRPKDDSWECLSSPAVPRIYSAATTLKNKIYVCGGCESGGKVSHCVESLDPDHNVWTKLNSLHTPRWGLSAVTLGQHIYVLGGRDDTAVHDCVERYSLVTGKWTRMAPMLTKRCFAGVSILNGKIYACGGYSLPSGHPAIPSAEVYDPIANEWNYIASMKVARCDFAILTCRGELYALGGNKSKWKNLYTCEIYDPKTDIWTFGPQIETDDYSWSAVVI